MDAAGIRRRSPAALALAVAAVAAAAHARSIACGFVILDDPYYVLENALVRGGLTARSLAYALALDGHQSYFHPLTWLSLMLDVELFGVRAWAFHAGNVALHAGAAALLFLVLRRFARDAVAAAAAVLFAVHPLAVEAVAWVAERKTVLSSFLGIAAVLSYLRYGERPARGRYAGALALHCLSLLAKPGLVLMPVVLLALDAWPLRRLGAEREGRRAWRRILLEKVPFACASAAVVVAAVLSARASAPHHVGAAILSRRALTAVAVVPEYLRAVVWPTDLVVFRPYPREVDFLAVAIGAAAVLAITGASVLLARRQPSLAVGWTWFLATVAPYLGLHQAGLWPYWADRFAYVPMMGIAIAATGAVDRLLGTRPLARRGAAALAALAAVALAWGTWSQTAVWGDSVALFRRAVELAPSNGSLQFRLGMALLAEGRLAEARAPLEASARLTLWSPDPYVMLGQLEEKEGRPVEAERAYLAALRINPRFPPALYTYAQFLSRSGRDARLYYARFMQVAPDEWAAQRSVAAEHLR
jgi:tetratricopeptide (TPR) repeat protein